MASVLGLCILFSVYPLSLIYVFVITEISPYKSDPSFPPNILILVKMGEVWGRNQNDKNG